MCKKKINGNERQWNLPTYFSLAATWVAISLHATKNKAKNKYTDREQVWKLYVRAIASSLCSKRSWFGSSLLQTTTFNTGTIPSLYKIYMRSRKCNNMKLTLLKTCFTTWVWTMTCILFQVVCILIIHIYTFNGRRKCWFVNQQILFETTLVKQWVFILSPSPPTSPPRICLEKLEVPRGQPQTTDILVVICIIHIRK